MGDIEGKIHEKRSEDNDQTSINDDSIKEDSTNIQDQESKGISPNTDTSSILTQKDVDATLKPLTNIIEHISKLVGLEAPKKVGDGEENGDSKVAERKRVMPNDSKNSANNKDNKENKEQQSSKNSTDSKSSSSEQASSSGGGLDLSNISKAATKFSDDPVVAMKEKAKELGRQMGLKAGNEEGQGKISAQENEAKFDAFLAQTGSPNPLPQSANTPAPATNAENITDSTAAPIASTTINEGSPATAANTTTTAPAAAPSSATAANADKDKKEAGPAITAEQAAEHITSEFKIGYNQGFNDGFTEGANAQIALNSPEVKAKALKETQAYKDGILAGQASLSAPGAETDARIKAFEDTHCKPFKDAQAAKASNPDAPAPTQDQENNNIAFNQGFNDGYTKAGNATIDAENKKKEAEKTSEDYKKGAEKAKDSIENPENEAKNEASLKNESELFKKGYHQGYNDYYTTKGNEAIMKERNAFTDAGLSTGEYQKFYEAGQKLGKEENSWTPEQSKIDAVFTPLFNTFKAEKGNPTPLTTEQEKKEKNNATAALNIGLEKNFINQHKEKQEAEKDKAKQSVIFQKAYAVGQVIGMLEVKGGNALLKQHADKFAAFFKEKKFNLGNKEAASLDTIKAFLLKESIEKTPPATINKDGKDIENPEHKDLTIGFNQGWDDGYKNDGIKGNQESSNTKGVSVSDVNQTPEYKLGYKDGIAVGKLSAETSKQTASTEDKQAFDAEIQKLTQQAKAKGEDFYKGFMNGMNDGYVATLNGTEFAENPLDTASQKANDVIKKYKDLGDTDMVQRLEKLYKDTYNEIVEEIYNSITKPIQASSQENDNDTITKDQFDTIPSDADLDKMQLENLGAKLGAQGELSDAYDDELADVEAKLAVADLPANEKANLEKIKAAIGTEVHDCCKVYKEAYIAATIVAKDKGYSYASGYIEQMKILQGPEVEITIGKIGKFSNKEYKKGKEAADSFGSAIRTNKMLDADPRSKYLSDEARPKMPKRVVSKSYKQGYEESFVKWSFVEYTILGIDIPKKFIESDIYKEYASNKEAKPDNGSNTTNEGLNRTTYGEIPIYKFPNNEAIAKDLKADLDGIIDNEVSFYKVNMLSSYYKDFVAYTNTYLLGLKDTSDIANTKMSTLVSKIEKEISTIKEAKDNSKLEDFRQKALLNIKELLAKFPKNTELQAKEKNIKTSNTLESFTTEYEDILKISKQEQKNLQDNTERKSDDKGGVTAEEFDYKSLKPNKLEAKIDGLEKTFKQKANTKENPFNNYKANIEKAIPEFQKGYEDAIDAVQKDKGLTDAVKDDMQQYLDKIGYAKGFIQKVATLGLEKNSKEKALNIIKEYLKFINFDFDNKSNIGMLKEYNDLSSFDIEPSDVLIAKMKSNAKFKILANKYMKEGEIKGSTAAELSFNLSNDKFAYVENVDYKKEKASALAAGPLGQKAVSIFEKLMQEVDKIKAFIDLQKDLDNLSKQLNNSNSINIDSIKQLKAFQALSKTLFGKTLENKDLNLDNKELKFSSNLKSEYSDNINTINTKNSFFDLVNNILTIKNNSNPIVSIYSSSAKQLGLTGSGLFLNGKDQKSRIENNVKFIIPSLEKGLIAKNKKGQDVKPQNQAAINEQLILKASSGKITLDKDSIKAALENTQSKVLDILNKEEMEAKQANKTSNTP